MTKNKSFFIFLLTAVFFNFSTSAQPLQNAEAAKQQKPATTYKLTADKVDPSRFYNTAVVQGLNKTTAKTSILEMKIGEKIRFGTIMVIAHRCWQAPLDQKPESKILIEVFEEKNAEEIAGEESQNRELTEKEEVRIFYGWIFASTPSISGLEHPIYDLTALSCKNKI